MSIFNKMSLPEVYERFLACGTGIVARCARRRLGRRRYEQAHPVRVRAHDSRASLTPAIKVKAFHFTSQSEAV